MARLTWEWSSDSGQSDVGTCGKPFLLAGLPRIATYPLVHTAWRAVQLYVEECNAKMKALIAGQPRALGVWPAATCETHELNDVWDSNVTLNAWTIAEAAQ